ncbi:uncharacterized protein L3040_009284 [Drepanopeziza brunnea f. sp. 'multigermtubi']|uniref:GPI anchored serine-threonine rich protein n=1 Tax=Marssonina brunnea f. sp. multigermtubi (strain MB_m1) TaxID=1072389 RepID=K1X234_MARBU|nr:GPI anchored serine-threonine rich protein [Drepanopeziza brunnea f. sp. 'multigermtubi' MB_m1]EKD19276.1 GPI anchored serine-threonine rich protein [Drepanopeziza brunnea f. sp. 'multigermtubi' MB_m1]KAJ5032689.1 hypothetical protein L3040_009284 [Drepanopeziza brunnea f. sp. 'multigermtubi']
MRYSTISAAILAMASSVMAQTADFAAMYTPTQNQQVAAGSVLDITWQTSTVYTGPVTIQLLQGATPSTLELGLVVAASIDQALGKFSWTVPTDLQSFATYGFKITLDSTASLPEPTFQFSFPFHITGLAAAAASSSSSPPSAPAATPVPAVTPAHEGYVAVPPPAVTPAHEGYAAVPPPAATPAPEGYAAVPPPAAVPDVPVYPAPGVPAAPVNPPAAYPAPPVHPAPAAYPVANTTVVYMPTGTGVPPMSSYTPATVTGNAGVNVVSCFAILAGLAVALTI